MTIRIAAPDTMTKSILTNRPIVGIMAFVRVTGTIAASFPSDLTAAAIWVGVVPAESTPFFVHGVIDVSEFLQLILDLKSLAD